MRVTRINRLLTVTAATFSFAAAQTRVDLRTQSKSVDFSAVPSTKPFQTGTSLPSVCGVGQMFFLSSAPAGQNSYGCTATNVWTLQAPGAALSISTAGTPVGTAANLDFSTGPGIVYATSDTPSGISLQTSLDTSLVQTASREQAGATLNCASASGSSQTYTCALSPSLTSYTKGMLINWVPDLTGAGGATTLNIDLLGPNPITEADGLTNPTSSDILAGRMYLIWYDGAVFRILSNGGSAGSAGTSGLSGATGAVGPQGPAGPAGPAGPTGATGPAGGGGATVSSGIWTPSGGDMGNNLAPSVGSVNGLICIDYMMPWSTTSWPGHLGAFPYAANGHVSWGIFSASGSLLYSSNTLGGPGETRTAWTFSGVTLTAGATYGWCMTSDNASDVVFNTAGGSGNWGYVAALDSTPHLYHCSNSSATSGGTNTMPASCGTRTPAGGNNTSQTPWFILWN